MHAAGARGWAGHAGSWLNKAGKKTGPWEREKKKKRNGRSVYKKKEEEWHSYPVWQQVGPTGEELDQCFYLRRNHNLGIWQFDWINNDNNPYEKYNSYAQWEDNNTAKSPLECNQQWKVWNTNTKTYIPDTAVIVKVPSKEEIEVNHIRPFSINI